MDAADVVVWASIGISVLLSLACLAVGADR
jgi:hypothetical protein